MVAYNEGLLDALSIDEIPALLHLLDEWVAHSELSLEDSHEDWKRSCENLLRSRAKDHV